MRVPTARRGGLPGSRALDWKSFSGGANAAARRLRFEVRGPETQPARVPTFEPGGIYNRVRQIHAVYGGQRQGGISTPTTASLV